MGWVAAAIGIFSAGAGIFGAKKQKKVDKAQAELQYQDNLEKIRRRKFGQEATFGMGTAFSQASGVLHTRGSSAQGYLDTMAREFRLELDWMRKFADEARRLGYKGASAAYTTNVLQSITSGIQTGASIYAAGGGGWDISARGGGAAAAEGGGKVPVQGSTF